MDQKIEQLNFTEYQTPGTMELDIFQAVLIKAHAKCFMLPVLEIFETFEN